MLGDRDDLPPWADLADHVVRTFAEIPPLILPG
jgi:hypothetical protein